ncbi:hypothetical protein CBS147333_842 [Penicillium roqueforti]|nr:hypothetical protein CBS147333_842 [Penicillium roqueforti]KAI3277411.1 hypothetical protein CBS147308_713 [Penicillium roqueforti]KAI3298357.1 hypothetical protein DTO002I6_2371 [Penicillium roqueforti]KAI3299301.1 hypothetical protein DTO003C3_432 [Penicillium roqueforti]
MWLVPQFLKNLWCRGSNEYPVFPPPEPEELLARPSVYRERLFQRIYRTPKDKLEDTPLFSLYRLYESLVLNDNIGLRNEIEYFCYAVLSAIPALLVESFNQRIELGLPRKADPIMSREEMEQYQKEDRIFESAPEWTDQVARLEDTLVILHDNEEILGSFDDKRASEQLAAKNILHWQPHIHLI